jgi:hypothetical protein
VAEKITKLKEVRKHKQQGERYHSQVIAKKEIQ